MCVAVLPAVVDRDFGGAAALPADPTGSVGTGGTNTSAQLRAPECVNHEHPFRLLSCITLDASFLFRILGSLCHERSLTRLERRGGLFTLTIGDTYEMAEETTLSPQ